MMGATFGSKAAPGTIRGDFGRDWGLKVQQNIVHGSDSPESAEREISLWFPDL
jgi:nucleoside-diphosphate kinase